MNNGLLIAGSSFVLILLAGLMGVFYLNRYSRKKGIKERIQNESAPERKEYAESARPGSGLLITIVRTLGESFKPKTESEVSKTKKRLLTAGFHGEQAALLFFGAKAALALLLTAMALIVKLTVLKTLPAPKFIALTVVSAVAGFCLPDLYLYRKKQNRKRKIFEGFPDALDLMVVCVEAGMGLDAAMKRVGEEMAFKYKVLSEELRLFSLELRAGKPRTEALRNLAIRTDLEDISSLVTLLIQTDRFGTRVAQALRVHSDSMRTRRYQRAEEIASQLPVKILFPLVFFILPSIVVTMVGPGIIKFYRVILKGTWQW